VVKGLPAVLIEAFSAAPLGGNGAAVVLLQRPAPASWMQRLAGRLRQSETAFLLARARGWDLRWFTPSMEVPLCGHATLAATLALHHWQRLAPEGATTFHTRSGPLRVGLLGLSKPGEAQLAPLAQLELPCFHLEPREAPQSLVSLLSERVQQAPERFWHSPLGYQVVLLQPSAPMDRLAGLGADLSGAARQGLVLMQALSKGQNPEARVAGERADYQVRFFAPGLGIDEDPVTGSAHALVAPYWMEHWQRPRVVGWQCSDRPGGMVCEASSSGMIRLTGSGHLLWEGTLWAEPERSWEHSAEAKDWGLACGP
jgi:PhzF family phenazine biosynthesis protein